MEQNSPVDLKRSAVPLLQDAASIVLMRDNDDGQFSILLLRRSLKQSFMGGAFVFPGGRADEADQDKNLPDCIAGLSVGDLKTLLQEPGISDTAALGLYLTALRETFEEAGVLLAYTASGSVIRLEDPVISTRFSTHRRSLYDHTLSLHELASEEFIKFALDLLTPYAHWITPEQEKKRFDTRFFIARIPGGQKPAHDRTETTGSRWMTPSEALDEQSAGCLLLMPPTLMIITNLNEFNSTEEVFQYAKSLTIRAILPQINLTPEKVNILLPWDPEYEIDNYSEPPRDGEISRVVLENGIWRTASKV